ncbi:hypothetical protein GHV78_27105, partial [Pseudomonas aeruginosa]|nr:hypothetical protein [Pseudomonas aeruginosa]
WLLFVIVFAGSLASFDKELTRWMQPDLGPPPPPRRGGPPRVADATGPARS